MRICELKLNLSDTQLSVQLVGLRFMVYTIKKLFENDDRLTWNLNVSTMVAILNQMNSDEQKKVMGMFSDFYTEVNDEQIEEFKMIFIPYYNNLMDEIQPTGIVQLIGDGFDDEVDDHIYLNELDM